MSAPEARASETAAGPLGEVERDDFVTMVVDDQLFGIPALDVQDVLGPQTLTRIPLAPAEVAGALNLRGHIVTAIDLRVRLGLAPPAPGASAMSITFDDGGELYSLLVDDVGEVLSLDAAAFEPNPATLDPILRDVARGIYPLEERLLVVLDPARLLRFGTPRAV